MARVVVEVMPKPEILDPQGKAVTGALERLGFTGFQVRQGKRFEIEMDGPVDEVAVARVRDAAEKLLCNTVIENFEVHVEKQSVAEKAEGGDDVKPDEVKDGDTDAKSDEADVDITKSDEAKSDDPKTDAPKLDDAKADAEDAKADAEDAKADAEDAKSGDTNADDTKADR